MWPLLSRELRAGSRRGTTYGLRMLAAAAVIAGVLYWFVAGRASPTAGSEVFTIIHRIVLGAVWVFVPLMTCDCLSQEKREGTLGLLFLTHLRAGEIVLAKAIAHGLRALTLWLAAVPVIGIPLLMGGLTWPEVFFSCCLTAASLCVALGVGLLASALSRRMNASVSWSALLAPMACVLFMLGTCSFLVLMAQWLGIVTAPELREVFSLEGVHIACLVVWNGDGVWRHLFGVGNLQTARAFLLGSALLVPLAATLLSLFAIFIIAPLLRGNWQDRPKSQRQTDLENFWCRPILAIGFFHRWLRRSLARNPIGWLEQRSWQGRLTAWIWLAIMISFASYLAHEAAHSSRHRIDFDVLMWLLLATIGYVAAGSFRRERETGALELILVTPLSVRQIISGRLRGLWTQFFPAVAVWMAVVIYLSSAASEWRGSDFAFWTVGYLTVPVIGLYFSLRSRFVLLAWLATLAAAFGLPRLVWSLIYLMTFWLAESPRNFSSGLLRPLLSSGAAILITQTSIAAFLLWRLHVNLRRRAFSFR